MTWIAGLMTLAEARRIPKPVPKGASRLQQQTASEIQAAKDEKVFLERVRHRDRMRCRKCGRKVVVQLARSAKRAEVHHLYGRRGWFRYEPRCAILVCGACHEALTGKVAERWRVVGTVMFQVNRTACIDANATVTFERIA
jgi:hypothetical protein